MTPFTDRLRAVQLAQQSLLCIGLDTDVTKLPSTSPPLPRVSSHSTNGSSMQRMISPVRISSTSPSTKHWAQRGGPCSMQPGSICRHR